MAQFPKETNFDEQVFAWDIYNRPSLQKWSKARVVCLGDAVHQVSPYAAYGIAIEDGYFLAKFLNGSDLSNLASVQSSFDNFENERVEYVNHHVEFARKLGNIFHQAPSPLASIRDFVFDRTKIAAELDR